MPDSLWKATVSFMSNARLLNQFTHIVFSKTYAFDPHAVRKTMDIITKWFTKIHRNYSLIPPDFDFTFFFKGVQMLLELNHGTSTAKAVKMLFHVLHIIPKMQRDRLVLELLLPENFYRFLFHWSCFVRNAFSHLYYFQLHRLLIEEDNKEVI